MELLPLRRNRSSRHRTALEDVLVQMKVATCRRLVVGGTPAAEVAGLHTCVCVPLPSPAQGGGLASTQPATSATRDLVRPAAEAEALGCRRGDEPDD